MLQRITLRGVMRWLLQADRPVPPRTEAEITAEMEQNYPWNFTVTLLDGASFWFGLSFISSSTIVPLFVSKLSDSPLPIGLVAVIAQSSWFLPQLFTANIVERLARKKPVVVNLGFFTERLPMWFIVVAALIATQFPLLALVLFLLSYAWHGIGAGVIATAWQDMFARCFPIERRGRLLGITLFVGAGAGALAAGFTTWLLKSFPFPTNFVYTFLIAAIGINVSWLFIALTREPVQPVMTPRQSNSQFWAGLPRVIREDHNFRRYLLARCLLALGGMGSGFITVAAVQRWSLPDSVVGGYTAVLLAGQTVGNLLFGLLADKYGHKLSMELAGLAGVILFGLAWVAPTPTWFYAVFFLSGLQLGAIIVSGILLVIEFSPSQKRPTYTGLSNTLTGLMGIVAPLIGATLASFSYQWLFILSGSVNLFALVVMRWAVQEPRYMEKYENNSSPAPRTPPATP